MNFQQPLLQSPVSVTWSFRNHTNMLIWIFIIINVENNCAIYTYILLKEENDLDQGRVKWSQARLWVLQSGNKMSKTKSGFQCKTKKNLHSGTHIASEVQKLLLLKNTNVYQPKQALISHLVKYVWIAVRSGWTHPDEGLLGLIRVGIF